MTADNRHDYRLNEIEREQICTSAIQAIHRVNGSLKHVPGLISKIIRERAWERRQWGTQIIELPNLRALIEERPIRGWGEKVEYVEACIKHDPEALLLFREALLGKEGGDKRSEAATTVNNINGGSVERSAGTSRSYSLSRVQKVCDPPTVQAVMRGDISAHRALLQAGVRQTRQVYLPRNPVEAAAKLLTAFGDDFSAALAASLAEAIQQRGMTSQVIHD